MEFEWGLMKIACPFLDFCKLSYFFAADVNFLTSLHVMDYSLLLGVHNVDLAAEEEANRLANPGWLKFKFGILLPKLFWPTVRKNCSSDRENLLKFEDFWDH